ncbi:hypothetical protein HDU85_006626 [Gaertneriomyces sp. JEL0708]|nr:hypothetical protein HDU85_006626 [Gaertneriomyces sp. JEL0708]
MPRSISVIFAITNVILLSFGAFQIFLANRTTLGDGIPHRTWVDPSSKVGNLLLQIAFWVFGGFLVLTGVFGLVFVAGRTDPKKYAATRYLAHITFAIVSAVVACAALALSIVGIVRAKAFSSSSEPSSPMPRFVIYAICVAGTLVIIGINMATSVAMHKSRCQAAAAAVVAHFNLAVSRPSDDDSEPKADVSPQSQTPLRSYNSATVVLDSDYLDQSYPNYYYAPYQQPLYESNYSPYPAAATVVPQYPQVQQYVPSSQQYYNSYDLYPSSPVGPCTPKPVYTSPGQESTGGVPSMGTEELDADSYQLRHDTSSLQVQAGAPDRSPSITAVRSEQPQFAHPRNTFSTIKSDRTVASNNDIIDSYMSSDDEFEASYGGRTFVRTRDSERFDDFVKAPAASSMDTPPRRNHSVVYERS